MFLDYSISSCISHLVVDVFGGGFSVGDDVVEVAVVDDQDSAGFQHLAEVADGLRADRRSCNYFS